MAASIGAVKVFDKDNNLVYEVMAINGDLPCSIELNGNTVKFTSVGSYYVPSNYGNEPSVNTQNISFEPTGSTNQTESVLTLPYAPTKIEYFGGNNGDFASESYQSNLSINQGETVETPSSAYSSGGGFALRYYEEVAQSVITLSNLKKFKELCDQTYAKTGGGSGGGTQLYMHSFTVGNRSYNIISTNGDDWGENYEKFTQDTFISGSFSVILPGEGASTYPIIGIYSGDSIYIMYAAYNSSGGLVSSISYSSISVGFSDTVTPL